MSLLLCHGLPAYGHLYPLLPLAAAARAAGHEVVFVTGAEFVPMLRSYGFPAIAAGVGPMQVAAEIFGGPVPRRPDGSANTEAQITLFGDELPRRTTAELRRVFAAADPDVVLYEQTAIGAGFAAAAEGVPAVSLQITAGATTSVVDPTLSPRFGHLLTEHGLDSIEDLRPLRLLDPFPAALQTGPAGRWTRTPVRPIAWSRPNGTTPRWLAESRRPVIYVTLGTIFGTVATFRQVLAGVARLGAEVLVAPGSVSADELGPLPDRVHVEGFVDQSRVLPLVDVAVHHGGSGTTLGAAAVGLPQLIMPSGADQSANAVAVVAAGSGRQLTPDEVNPGRVAAEVARLLEEPTHTAAAQRIRRQIAAMPGPAHVVDLLTRRVAAA